MFLTFIVKEGLRERWKESADAIDTAQYIYGIRNDAAGIKRSIDDLRDISYGMKVWPTGDRQLSQRILFLEHLKSDHDILDRSDRTWQELNILVSKLPESDDAGALTAVKDKARFHARACGPP